MKKKLLVFYNSVSVGQPNALSGGDRILFELVKRWESKFEKIDIVTCSVGNKVISRYLNKSKKINIKIIKTKKSDYQNLAFLYLKKTYLGIKNVFQPEGIKFDYVYSSSDFWPDAIPAFILKIKQPETRWLAGFYLTAPSPWQKDSPYRGAGFWRGFFYWLTQLPVYFLVKHWADYVLVTSEPDVEKFVTEKRNKEKVIVVQGGVDIAQAKKHSKLNNIELKKKKKFDACFVGRFHFQKGVLELIDIWDKVVADKPKAKLAMIGVGPLEDEIKKKIKYLNLEKNIDLLGFMDGQDKYEVFKESRLMVHPATYDSGGMAAAEGMAWGLPAVSFDLKALRTYYPQGMIKIEPGNIDHFAQVIVNLLNDQKLYNKTASEAVQLIEKVWDWDKRGKKLFQKLFDD